ncbi:type II toxin-antitoxin system VapC family toxin [Azospirillum sp.]|uniref:type II toxin-antitoxin system VapC family toxin n=1 Tax=Azospirillum sp. TaxID=34012 RepID=UPI002D5296CC|nr:type II toxin-antitoxin system VapC family toxin [Azospirillum sp.]HYD68660.1 type II toxin-antitoxin system VapC family toxin [Azospirillum sp.]
MATVVVDASVAVKWVVAEEGSNQALALRRERHLTAPDLIVAECANILWKKARRNELTADEAAFAARLLQKSGMNLRPMLGFLEVATRLAVELDHPAYDCVYLAMAQIEGTSFVTADDRLLRKVRAMPAHPMAACVVGLHESPSRPSP